MSATNCPTHTSMGSPRAAAPRKQTHHRLAHNAVLGNALFRFVLIIIMFFMILVASPVSALPASLSISDLVAAANATAHHFIVRFLGIPATHNHPELSLAFCATGNSSTLSNGDDNSNSSVAQYTAHWVPTFCAPSATSGIWSHVPTPTMIVDGSGSLNRNYDSGISAWIRAANLSALSDAEIESAVVRLFKASSATTTKQMASILSPVHVDMCSRLTRPHVFVHPSCRSLANPPKSCPRVAPAPSHGFWFPVCLAHDEPVFVAATELLFAQHQVASCLAVSLAAILLVLAGTAAIARRKVAAHAKAIQMHMDLAVGIAGKQVTGANQSLASMHHDLDDALAQRDVAHIERDAAVGTRELVIAERDTAIAQRDVASSQRGTAVAERDSAIIELEALAAQLVAVAAERDAALAARDTATAGHDATVNLLTAAQAANKALKAVLAKVISFAALALFVARGAMAMKRRADEAAIAAVQSATIAREEVTLAQTRERDAIKVAGASDVRAQVAHDEMVAAQQQVQQAQAEAESLVCAANGRVATVQAQLDAAQEDLAAANAEVGIVNAKLVTARTNFAAAEADRNDSRAQCAAARSDFASAKAELADAHVQRDSARADLAATQADRDDARARLVSAHTDLAATRAELVDARAHVTMAEAHVASARTAADESAKELAGLKTSFKEVKGLAKVRDGQYLKLCQVLKVSPGFCRLCTAFECKQPDNPEHLWLQLENGCEAFASLIRKAHGRGLPTSHLPLTLARRSGHERKQLAHQQNHQQYQQQQLGQQPQPQPHSHSHSHSHSYSHSHPYSQPQPHLYSQPQPQLHQQPPQVYFVPLAAHPHALTHHVPPPPPAPRVRFPEPRPGLDSATDLSDEYP